MASSVSCQFTNNTLEQVCYNHGTCSVDPRKSDGSMFCLCERGWSHDTYCGTLAMLKIHPSDTIFYGIALAINIIYFLVISTEFGLDLRLHKDVSWKRPALIAKGVIVAHTILGMILYSCSLYEITEGELLSAVLMTLLDSFSGLMTAICLALITVGWISIVMKSKSLGQTNKRLRGFRVFVFAMICVLTPALTICQLLNCFKIETLYTLVVNVIGQVAFILILVFGTSYHIVKTMCWAFEKKSKKSRTMRKVGLRTTWLLAINIILIAYLFSIVGLFLEPMYMRVCTFFMVGFFILFLENYIFKYSRFYLGLTSSLDSTPGFPRTTGTHAATTSDHMKGRSGLTSRNGDPIIHSLSTQSTLEPSVNDKASEEKTVENGEEAKRKEKTSIENVKDASEENEKELEEKMEVLHSSD